MQSDKPKELIFTSSSFSLDDTARIAKEICSLIQSSKFVGLYGELGAGKTTFIKYLVALFGIKENVSSPTYVIEHEYNTDDLCIKHVDLYRVNAIPLDLFDKTNKKTLYLIEWADKVSEVHDLIEIEIYFELKILPDNNFERKINVFRKGAAKG